MKNRTKSYRRDIETVNKGKTYFLAAPDSRPINEIVNLILQLGKHALHQSGYPRTASRK